MVRVLLVGEVGCLYLYKHSIPIILVVSVRLLWILSISTYPRIRYLFRSRPIFTSVLTCFICCKIELITKSKSVICFLILSIWVFISFKLVWLEVPEVPSLKLNLSSSNWFSLLLKEFLSISFCFLEPYNSFIFNSPSPEFI